MNEKEQLKKCIIEACVNGNLTVKQAANRLNFTERYVKKLKQNYSNLEITIIYGIPTDLKKNELHKLINKAIDKYSDWHVATFLLHKYDVNGNIR